MTLKKEFVYYVFANADLITEFLLTCQLLCHVDPFILKAGAYKGKTELLLLPSLLFRL